MLKEMHQLEDGSMVDKETGELMDCEKGTFVYIPHRVRIKENWFMTFQNALEELSTDREIWGQPLTVFTFLLSQLSFENYIMIQQTEISTRLGLNKTRVSEAIKKLTDKKVLLKGPKMGRTWSYKLNSKYGWKGKIKNLIKHEQKLSLIQGGRE